MTAFGQALGTPAYMSPEQAEATGLDVDTRADIYSLGVILYELVVGRLPIDPTEMGLSNFLLALTGRGNDPPRPSARLKQLGEAADPVAALRRTDGASLTRSIEGDLDWIVMKAIEKDRDRRYETANALARDLQRYLGNEAVAARPPSAGYRLRKLVRRTRVSAIAIGLLVLSVAAGAVATAVGFVRARRAEARATREAQVAERTASFLARLFAVSNPSVAGGGSLTARELLDSGAVRLDHELENEPQVKGRLLRTIGSVYSTLGLLDRAEPLLRCSIELARDTRPVDSAAMANGAFALGSLLSETGDVVAAESLLAMASAIRSTLRGVPDSTVAHGLYAQGRLAFPTGRPGGCARLRPGGPWPPRAKRHR